LQAWALENKTFIRVKRPVDEKEKGSPVRRRHRGKSGVEGGVVGLHFLNQDPQGCFSGLPNMLKGLGGLVVDDLGVVAKGGNQGELLHGGGLGGSVNFGRSLSARKRRRKNIQIRKVSWVCQGGERY